MLSNTSALSDIKTLVILLNSLWQFNQGQPGPIPALGECEMDKQNLVTEYDGKYCTTCEDDCKWQGSCPKRKILILPYAERIKIMSDILKEKYDPS